jgi:hypothetical protein
MWTVHTEKLFSDRVLKTTIYHNSSPVPYAEVLRLWQSDPHFRSFFSTLLAESPFSCFRWETPSLTTTTANRPFEFVVIDSPGLASHPDPETFAPYFSDGVGGGVVEFPNLGGDAILIAPCPLGPLAAYCHLGSFLRQAPEPQQQALWEMVGTAMQRRLGDKPVWLSTAGGGVSWLHVRLDDRPKYYGYGPYRHD